MLNDPLSIILFCIFMAILLVIMVGIPTGIAYLLFNWLKKKGYKTLGLILIFIVFILSSWNVYTAFYPQDRFYKKEFESHANIPLPKEATILARGASYPDIHGNYFANAIIQLSANDFVAIYTRVTSNPDFKIQSSEMHFNQPFDKKPVKAIDIMKFTEVYLLDQDDERFRLTVGFNKEEGLIGFEVDE